MQVPASTQPQPAAEAGLRLAALPVPGLPAWPEAPDVARLRESAGEAAALLKALAHPDRLMLLCRLVAAECSVGELGQLTGLLQPSLSQQLGVLRGERLVTTRREGKRVVYRIASPAAAAVLGTLYSLYCRPQENKQPRGCKAGHSTRSHQEPA